MKVVFIGVLVLLTAGCASLPVTWSIVASDASKCAVALAMDAAAVAADPAVVGLAVAPSIAGVLAVLSSIDKLLPGTIQACSPFVNDVQAEFGGTVVTPSTTPPHAALGAPGVPVPNPWKGMLRAGK